jgi:hypothetical protein
MSDRTYYSEEARARAMRENAIAVGKALVAGIAMGAVGSLLINPSTRKQIAKASLKQADHAADEAKGLSKMLAKATKQNRKQAVELLTESAEEATGLLGKIKSKFA